MAMGPQHLTDPSFWTARDFPDTRAWVRTLTPESLEELDAAVCDVIARGKKFYEVTREDFPLPKTAALLAETYDDLENGVGFAVIGGFPVDRYSYDEALVAYAGLCTHLGVLVSQSYAGAMKVDVTDTGKAYSKAVRGYESRAMLRFHTDGAIFTGLLCLGEALEGGESVLVSCTTLHNQVIDQRPDLYPILETGFYHHRRGEHAPGEHPISSKPIPVFGFNDGHLLCTYDRNQSLWAADEGIEITPKQIEAMDFIDQLMGQRENQLHMEMKKGDIQFVNNFTVMHSRNEYTDGEGKKRHLVRFWIDAPDSKRQGVTTRDLYVRDSQLETAG